MRVRSGILYWLIPLQQLLGQSVQSFVFPYLLDQHPGCDFFGRPFGPLVSEDTTATPRYRRPSMTTTTRRHGAYEDYMESLKRSNSSPDTEDPTPSFTFSADLSASASASAMEEEEDEDEDEEEIRQQSTAAPLDPTATNRTEENSISQIDMASPIDSFKFNKPSPPRTPPPLSGVDDSNVLTVANSAAYRSNNAIINVDDELAAAATTNPIYGANQSSTETERENYEHLDVLASTTKVAADDGPTRDSRSEVASEDNFTWVSAEETEFVPQQLEQTESEQETDTDTDTDTQIHSTSESSRTGGIAEILRQAKDAILVDRYANPPVYPNEVPLSNLNTAGMTERIMKRTAAEAQATGAGGVSTWEAFQRTEQNWARLKAFQPFVYDPLNNPNGIAPPPQFVTQDVALGSPECWAKLRESRDKPLDFDVVVCGATLGIFFATALRLKGYAVCVLEAGPLRGREQEWNISMDELMELVEMGVLSIEDVDAAVQTAFPGCRSGFKQKEVTPLEGGWNTNDVGYECFTENVLNLGISPAILLERVAQRFFDIGGVILEETPLYGVCVSETVGAALDLGEEYDPLTAQLVIDCMGNASPISRQQRYGMKPDGICAVVGSCASGYDPETNLVGDIIYTNTPIQDKGRQGKLQYFWEAFPVGIGRNGQLPGTSTTKTTYMFTYMDADERRPSLETLMEDYWRLLPTYQPSISNPETDLDVRRVLFAFFPTYTDSPLQPQWDRVLPVGDASGIQSPLSFGGFGALTRHLNRISTAIDEALEYNLLEKEYLAEINPYTPNLSAAWMFQKAMSVRVGQRVDPKFVNRLLAVNFEVMNNMGQRTIKPFLQDVIRFDGLIGSLARSFNADPFFMPEIVAHVGIPRLVDWVGHVSMMGYYSFLDTAVSPIIKPFVDKIKNPKERYLWRRRIDAWKYGSGNDYILPDEN